MLFIFIARENAFNVDLKGWNHHEFAFACIVQPTPDRNMEGDLDMINKIKKSFLKGSFKSSLRSVCELQYH